MPFTPKQNHLFRAISHGWKPPESSGIKIDKSDATRMAHEGVKGVVAPPKKGLQQLVNSRKKVK